MASDLTILVECYLRLLRQHGVTRLKLQSALACLRDEIARLSGWDAQRVQDHCEAVAYLMTMEGRRE